MKSTIKSLIAAVVCFATASAISYAEDYHHKFIYVERDSFGKPYSIGNIGTITFAESYETPFYMSIGDDEWDIFENTRISLTSPELSLSTYSLHLDKSGAKSFEFTDNRWLIDAVLPSEFDIIDKSHLIVNCDADWLSCSIDFPDSGENADIVLVADENNSGQRREADVEIVYHDMPVSKKIHVIQEPELFIDPAKQPEGCRYVNTRAGSAYSAAKRSLVFNTLPGIKGRVESIKQYKSFNINESEEIAENECMPVSIDFDPVAGKMTCHIGGDKDELDGNYIIATVKFGELTYRLAFYREDMLELSGGLDLDVLHLDSSGANGFDIQENEWRINRRIPESLENNSETRCSEDWVKAELLYFIELPVTVVSIRAEKNTTGCVREADVEVLYDGSVVTQKIHVIQEPELFIDPAKQPEECRFVNTKTGSAYSSAKRSLVFNTLPGIEGRVESIKQYKSFNINESEEIAESECMPVAIDFDPVAGKMTCLIGGDTDELNGNYIIATVKFGELTYRLAFYREDMLELSGGLDLDVLHLDSSGAKSFDIRDNEWLINRRIPASLEARSEARSSGDWLKVGLVDAIGSPIPKVSIRAEKNTTGRVREADVEVLYDGSVVTQKIHVIQEPELFIDPAKQPEECRFVNTKTGNPYGKGSKTFVFNVFPGLEGRIESIKQYRYRDRNSFEDIPADEYMPVTFGFDAVNGRMTCTVGQSGEPTDQNYIVATVFIGDLRYELSFYHEDMLFPGMGLSQYNLHVDKTALKDDLSASIDRAYWFDIYNPGEDVEVLSGMQDWFTVRRDGFNMVFSLTENNTGSPREATVRLGMPAGVYERDFHIRQEAELFLDPERQEPGYIKESFGPQHYVQWQGDKFVLNVLKGIPVKLNYTRQYYEKDGQQVGAGHDELLLTDDKRLPFEFAHDPDAGTITITVGENKGLRTVIETEYCIGSNTRNFVITAMESGTPTFAEQRAALEQLYTSTNGDAWTEHTNWMSDAPLASWSGIRVCGKYVTHVYLSQNNIIGELPNEALGVLIQAPVHFEITDNGLYGALSDEIQQIAQWSESDAGLSILSQNPFYSGKRRITNYKHNIRAENENVEYLEPSDGKTTLYDVLSGHKLNLIGVGGPDEPEANMQLSYPGKFMNITTHWPVFEDRNTIIENCNKHPFAGQSVHLWDCLRGYGLSNLGSMAIIDDNGYIVEVLYNDWSIPRDYYSSIVAETLREYFGEPQEHEWLVYPDTREPQDTKNDGKYKCLNKATAGSGLDIVLMGDGFGAADNEGGAKYEQLMNEAMERIFTVEPLKSLRDRINVYMIHVVSQSTVVGDGLTALNYDDEKCREYAAKIPGVDLDRVTIVNITNRLEWHGSSYTSIKESGWAVAHIVNGGVSDVMVHEVVGHGVGRFLDEYIVAGYQDNKVSDENMADFKAWLDKMHAAGIGLNLDYTDDPQKIAWAHMLADPRYEGLVGIYQGADKYPFDLWRSTENSLMGTANSAPSAVQREILYKRIMHLSEGDGWVYDYEKFAEFDAPNR